MSFGQELKDFLSAAQAGAKIIGAVSDEEYKHMKMKYQRAITQTVEDKNNDKEGDKLTKDAQRSLISSRNANTAYVNERRGLVGDQRKILSQPPAADPMYSPGALQPGIRPAVPTEAPAAPPPPRDSMDLSAADPEQIEPQETEAVPVAMASRGGAIQHFADGGAVGEEDDEETEDPNAPDEVETPPAVGGSTDVSSRARGTPKFSIDAGLDAGAEGLKYGVRAAGLHQPAGVQDPRRARALAGYARGAGAASPLDMDAARKAVDPGGKLSESQRNLAALGAVYQYKLNKDDVQGAQRAAFSMIQHYRVASQRYAAITAAAVDKGDLDGAAMAAMKAYANVPDGKDFHVQKTPDGKFKFSFTDEKTGKVLEQGIEAPDKLAAAAIGFAQKGFDASLLQAAGQRAEKEPKGAVDPNAPMKAADRKAATAGIDKAYEDQNPEPEGDAAAAPARSKDDVRALKGAAFRITSNPANKNLTHDEAVATVSKIADPSLLGKSSLEVKKAEGGYMVTIDKRQPTFVADDDMGALMARRNAKKAELDQKTKDDAKPGAVSRAVGAAKELAAPVGDYLQSLRHGTRKEAAAEEARRKTFTEPSIP